MQRPTNRKPSEQRRHHHQRARVSRDATQKTTETVGSATYRNEEGVERGEEQTGEQQQQRRERTDPPRDCLFLAATETGELPVWRDENGHPCPLLATPRDPRTAAVEIPLTHHRPRDDDLRLARSAVARYCAWWRMHSSRTCQAPGCTRAAAMRCGRCHAARFCSAECLAVDWARTDPDPGRHRAMCRHLRPLADAATCEMEPSRECRRSVRRHDPCAAFKRLLREYDARGVPPPRFCGHMVYTDAPYRDVLSLLAGWSYCWSIEPVDVPSSLDPRGELLKTVIASSRLCCRPEVVALVPAGPERDGWPCACELLVFAPCECHDHEHCFRSVARPPRSQLDELMDCMADERELSALRVRPPCVCGLPLLMRTFPRAICRVLMDGAHDSAPSDSPFPLRPVLPAEMPEGALRETS